MNKNTAEAINQTLGFYTGATATLPTASGVAKGDAVGALSGALQTIAGLVQGMFSRAPSIIGPVTAGVGLGNDGKNLCD
jgi:hypothetical protein